MISLIKYPKRWKALLATVVVSIIIHILVGVGAQVAPYVRLVVGLRGIEFEDEDYNIAALDPYKIDKPLRYPANYPGFKVAKKTLSEEELKKKLEELKRKEEARLKKEEAARKKREAEEKLLAEQKTNEEKVEKAKTDKGYAGFGKINTRPIRDQIQNLYESYKKGNLTIPNEKFRIVITGKVNPDGSLSDYKVTHSSGIPDIDKGALGLLASISESRAMGPLSTMTSLTLIFNVDKDAELTIVGFAENEEEAGKIATLADAAIFVGKIKKSNDPAAMVMLNNLKVRRSGQRVEAVITVPVRTAKETLNKSLQPKIDIQGKS